MSSSAVVTGGSGWLGRRLLAAFHEGLVDVPPLSRPRRGNVRCLSRSERDGEVVRRTHPDAECVSGDLCAPDSLARLFDGTERASVFHCAGMIHPRRVREFYQVNVDGTEALLEAAIRAGARRFIHVSSNSPLGCNPHREHRFDEESPYNPYMHYGRSKKQAEDLVNARHARGEIETVVVRAPWFYGPGQPPRQTTFFTMIKNGKVPMVGGGENLRSMVYVDNLVQGLLLAEANAGADGRTYWISDRRPYSMREIVTTVADVLEQDFGMEVRRGSLNLPGLASECALLVDKMIQGLGFYHQKIHVLSEMNKNIACSVRRAEEELGYDPRVELREGMVRSVQALLDEGSTF
jgi:nucleoside-diphosphate-sugar epimerase